MRVLIVEDDPNLQLLWEAVFEQSGHQSVYVGCKAEALKLLAVDQFDLILLDLYLSDGNGIDLANQIDASDTHTPIVVVTGSRTHQSGELFGASKSVVAVLRKPVDIEDLIDVTEFVSDPNETLSVASFSANGLEIRGCST
jgi:DNA-binding response OmpR family regulator